MTDRNKYLLFKLMTNRIIPVPPLELGGQVRWTKPGGHYADWAQDHESSA